MTGNLDSLKLFTVGIIVSAIFISLVKKTKETFGTPWNNSTQVIPGRIECEWYDLGGEGVAYHDLDSINNGSGLLNPANGTILNEFRMKEGVDISYTKSNKQDNSEFNIVTPEMGKLYVGWTKPTEWLNYSINVNNDGIYNLGLNYTSNGEGGVCLALDGEDISKTIVIPSTRNEKDSISWRQWHHWNYLPKLAEVKLSKGPHVLTLKTVVRGEMNYDYLNFEFSRVK